jgi:hypothetical protein
MSENSQSSPFEHLVGRANGDNNIATCLYLDGIISIYSLRDVLDFVEEIFRQYGEKPTIILVGMRQSNKWLTRSMKWVRAAVNDKEEFFRTFRSMQFFPQGRTTIDTTWMPSVYFTLSIGSKSPSAFLCVNKSISYDGFIEVLENLNVFMPSCAAYIFQFPIKFSPLAYFWGIEVTGGRQEDSYGDRQGHRLSNWRDNSSIGILQGGQRVVYKACDGYVRDAYPVMRLSPEHLERRVGCSDLRDAIAEYDLGMLSFRGKAFVWRIPDDRLDEAQKLLDDNDISLSGRRLK